MAIERQAQVEERRRVLDFPKLRLDLPEGASLKDLLPAVEKFKRDLDAWVYELTEKLQEIQNIGTTDDIPEGSAQYFTAERARASVSGTGPITYSATTGQFSWSGTTSNVPEGTNLYYTAARFNTAFGAKSTTDLAEGANLYFTDARGNTNFSTNFTTKLGTAQTWTAKQTFTGLINVGLAAYTADDESAAYVGIDNLQAGTVYATVADLNALRVAYENLRAAYQDVRAKVNA